MTRPKLISIERLLSAMPATRKELEVRTGYAKTTVARNIAELHDYGWVHVGGWCRASVGGPFNEIFHAGPGKDKPCPLKPYTKAEKARRHMAKIRKAGLIEEFRAMERARYHADRAKLKPQSWLSLLGL